MTEMGEVRRRCMSHQSGLLVYSQPDRNPILSAAGAARAASAAAALDWIVRMLPVAV